MIVDDFLNSGDIAVSVLFLAVKSVIHTVQDNISHRHLRVKAHSVGFGIYDRAHQAQVFLVKILLPAGHGFFDGDAKIVVIKAEYPVNLRL